VRRVEGVAYFPGCSLKDSARSFEISASYVMETLGIPLIELERWNCCGTVFSLTDDDLMHHIASVRNLVRAQEMGAERLIALCSMCYNTLRRVADRINTHAEDRTKINEFMDQETDYEGNVTVGHLLDLLRDEVGWDRVMDAVVRPLEGLGVATYYGCTLVRPRASGIDDPERPTVMADAVESVGATPVMFPFQTECCGSYHVVDRRDLSIERSYRVLRSARVAGAQVVATACPLCQFNLEQAQTEGPGDEAPLVLYFTELLALALGWDGTGSEPSKRILAMCRTPVEGGT